MARTVGLMVEGMRRRGHDDPAGAAAAERRRRRVRRRRLRRAAASPASRSRATPSSRWACLRAARSSAPGARAGPTWCTSPPRARSAGRRSPPRAGSGSRWRPISTPTSTPTAGTTASPGSRARCTAYLRRFHNRADCTMVPTRGARRAPGARRLPATCASSAAASTRRCSRPRKRSAELRAGWGADEDTPVALCVSRFAPEKNFPLVIETYEAMRAHRPDLKLVLVGDGPMAEALTPAQRRLRHRRPPGERRALGALRLGRHLPVPEHHRDLRQRHAGGDGERPGHRRLRLRRGARAPARTSAPRCSRRSTTAPPSSPRRCAWRATCRWRASWGLQPAARRSPSPGTASPGISRRCCSMSHIHSALDFIQRWDKRVCVRLNRTLRYSAVLHAFRAISWLGDGIFWYSLDARAAAAGRPRRRVPGACTWRWSA